MSIQSNFDAPFDQRGGENLFEEELSVTSPGHIAMSIQSLKRLTCIVQEKG